ncbi:MAG: hypothetical protein V8T86_06150 [Victivallis sp.]
MTSEKKSFSPQLLQRVLRRLPGVDDLSAAHRAGTVEGDREVDGLDQSRLPRRRRCRNRDADHRFLRVSCRENGVFGSTVRVTPPGAGAGTDGSAALPAAQASRQAGSEAEQGQHSFHQIPLFLFKVISRRAICKLPGTSPRCLL